MKNLIQENGILKTFIFIIALAIPLSAVAIYVNATIDWPYFIELRSERTYFFVVLCWIFFGVRSKDFFGEGKKNTLKHKHTMMLTLLVAINFEKDSSLTKLLVALAWVITVSRLLDSKNAGQGAYWQTKISTNNLVEKDIVAAVKKEFFVTKSIQLSNSVLIRGYGLWLLKAEIRIDGSNTYIQIQPMNTGLTFLIGFKVIPINVGKYYGERILKNLGLVANEFENSMVPSTKYEA